MALLFAMEMEMKSSPHQLKKKQNTRTKQNSNNYKGICEMEIIRAL